MDCLFCKIINQEIPSYKVYENEYVYSFLDVKPVSNGHLLIIPKKHFENFSSCDDKYLQEVILAKKYLTNLLKEKLNPVGFNYLSNENPISGQTVLHYHEHIMPKYEKEKGFILKAEIADINEVKETFNKITK
ncbi:HIT family protein [Mycoplasma capricolum subsp. capripneumoniae]|uniref:Histidine triad (HIT) nucleotide-binding protein n=2 Tax=Mycoplasma capricolum TaxID=2095 RepID=A0A9N7AT17_MYCCC|nr:HIT family protein [Mycoplasma capricolum]AJK51511.1 Histidine triad (HIT) nucleotide-binding protein [Mycoplasma capricolum subsp. capripneumoniae 87001]AQU77540.1 HIT family protein [Mycoplasma capricolum subsp. capripneumoniae]KEY84547.1 Histidine triad protein [Mycoplasma capricolum subsp. capripneumoniae 99108]KEZ19138.1 Histidine triad protein [Mycoplasma capricolum subsp. capricolum 14232]QDL19639.1 HIT family protein [Mycoplasma capricolum subsp. capripneumoniae]